MDIAYWVVASLLALFYLYSGGVKVFRTRERLQPMMAWVDTTPMPVVRAIGVVEVLGAIGLILPPLTDVAVWLAFAAAVGFVLLQVGALRVHLVGLRDRRVGLNIALMLTAAVTGWLATTWL